MTASITIKMDNAAFEQPATELGRILRELAEKIEQTDTDQENLRDINGNRVGYFQILE